MLNLQGKCALDMGMWNLAYVDEQVIFLGVPFCSVKMQVIPNAWFTEYSSLVKNALTVSLSIQMKNIWRIKGVEKKILPEIWAWKGEGHKGEINIYSELRVINSYNTISLHLKKW